MAEAPCEHCGCLLGVLWESSRTNYYPEAHNPDPNYPRPLCRVCARDHHEYWDAMWEDYYASQR